MMRRQQDQYSRAFCELSTFVFNLLRSPPTPIPFSDHFPTPAPPVVSSSSPSSSSGMTRGLTQLSAAQITPTGFASLLLGLSLSLMLCGSVTFFIGFLLMPWVLGLAMVFYVAGIVSMISMFGRSLLCYAADPPPCPRKDIPAWKLM